MGNRQELVDEILQYDKVKTHKGVGVITAIEHCYEGMPFTVAFPDGSFDYFEACEIELIARPVYALVSRSLKRGEKKLYLAYNDTAA